jgi:hypothetical protein
MGSASAEKKKPSVLTRVLGALVFLGLVVVVIYVITRFFAGGGSPSITDSADVPPAGSIWFGSTFDTDTLELSGRTSSVSASQSFAMVGHTRRSLEADELVIRIYWNGNLVNSSKPDASGSGDLWGFSPGPLTQTGNWKFEITDVGGNVLASGTVLAQ